MRQVHWKSTARRGEIMVKTFEEELGGRVSLVLCCEPAELPIIDNAVRAAGSLGVAALQASRPHRSLERRPNEISCPLSVR